MYKKTQYVTKYYHYGDSHCLFEFLFSISLVSGFPSLPFCYSYIRQAKARGREVNLQSPSCLINNISYPCRASFNNNLPSFYIPNFSHSAVLVSNFDQHFHFAEFSFVLFTGQLTPQFIHSFAISHFCWPFWSPNCVSLQVFCFCFILLFRMTVFPTDSEFVHCSADRQIVWQAERNARRLHPSSKQNYWLH